MPETAHTKRVCGFRFSECCPAKKASEKRWLLYRFPISKKAFTQKKEKSFGKIIEKEITL
ncbi:hypothetical protein [Ruminococcus sp.]|uniref:hypothetical protein n=1 Tax=Ruminococcus sp. TaxID=41978 RepID=UPI000A94A108|nr:hypothetical protein [Ruminococcus callidus]